MGFKETGNILFALEKKRRQDQKFQEELLKKLDALVELLARER